MPSEATAPKRKRGRPPGTVSHASRRQNEEPREYEADGEDERRPKKRGRPRKSVDPNADNSIVSQGQGAVSTPVNQGNKVKKKRGRPSLADKRSHRAGEPELEAGIENLALKTRDPNAGRSAANEGESSSKPQKKRGRPSLKNKTSEVNGATSEQSHLQQQGQRRRSDVEDDAEEEQDHAQNKKGRTRLSLEDRIAILRRQSEVQQSIVAPSDLEEAEQPEGRRKKKRRRHSSEQEQEQDQNEESDIELPPKTYLHLAPQVRGIKQSTIDAKWSPLGTPSIAVATQALELAHHPVLQRMSGSSSASARSEHASAALALLYKRITRKLHRGLPFPPAGASTSSNRGDGGRETELDFESVILAVQSLQKQLDPALGAVELLRKEKERLERELERDYKMLRTLEAGAKGQAREQREQLKKAHVLVPECKVPVEQDLEMAFDGGSSLPAGTLFKDIKDEEIKDLALQLGGHMESIKANLQQTEGILPRVADSRAALRRVLLQHLDDDLYEKAVLG